MEFPGKWIGTDYGPDVKHLPLIESISETDISKEEQISENVQGILMQSNDPSDSAVPCTPPGQIITANESYLEGFSPEIYFDNIHHQLGLEEESSFLPKGQSISINTEDNLSVYSDLILLNESNSPENAIDLNNVQLYLECTDDNENTITTSALDRNPNVSVQCGTSLLKSDVRLKISFPVFPEERDKGLRCSSCKRYFSSESILRSHIVQKHQQEVHVCSWCSYNTRSLKFFHRHTQTKHKYQHKVLHGADRMSETTLPKIPVIQHDEGCKDEHIVTAELCEVRQDLEATKMQDCIKESACDHDFVCMDNASLIDNNKSLNLKSVNENLNFVCSICKFVTKSSRLLNMHKNTMHNVKRTIFRCNECSYVCKQKRSLVCHERLHQGLLKYTCEVCVKKFVSKAIYSRHKKIHTMERKYVCINKCCNKSFKSKGALTDHRKKVCCNESCIKDDQVLHGTDVRKAEKGTCTSCDWAVTGKLIQTRGVQEDGNSARITTIVTKNKSNSRSERSSAKCTAVLTKSFHCTYPGCQKSFRDSFNLRNHLCVHDGVKMMHCELCNFSCVQRNSLNYHLKKKHPDIHV